MSEFNFFSSLNEIIRDLQAGKIVCLSDRTDLENEIDMMCLGEHATPENINYMAKFARGFICCVLPDSFCQNLGLNLNQYGLSKDHRGTPFAGFLDLASCDTGISAFERSKTITALSEGKYKLEKYVQGHVPVLHARKGLLSKRLGHTEMSSQLSFEAGHNGSAVICEILNEDGQMLRVKDFQQWNFERGLKLYSMEQILEDLNITPPGGKKCI